MLLYVAYKCQHEFMIFKNTYLFVLFLRVWKQSIQVIIAHYHTSDPDYRLGIQSVVKCIRTQS
jgi:hypothetical protein